MLRLREISCLLMRDPPIADVVTLPGTLFEQQSLLLCEACLFDPSLCWGIYPGMKIASMHMPPASALDLTNHCHLKNRNMRPVSQILYFSFMYMAVRVIAFNGLFLVSN